MTPNDPPNRRECVFCQSDRKFTREHVWPQWLRQYPAYEALKADKSADALPRAEFPEMTLDDSGRIIDRVVERGNAPLLPDVTVKVCATCNSEWLGQLEDAAKRILDPWFSGRRGPDYRRTTAVGRLGSEDNDDLHHVATSRAPRVRPGCLPLATKRHATPDDSLIWMAFSRADIAHVALSVRPHL